MNHRSKPSRRVRWITAAATLALTAISFVAASTPANAATFEKYVFRVRTQSKSIVGNISIQARDIFEASSKVRKRYPGCEILNVKKP